MALLGQVFDLDQLPESEGSGDYAPLPEGWYSTRIESCVLNKTKDETGEYLKLCYVVTGPTHQGRKIFGNINLKNRSDKAELIGLQQLRELMTAAGLKSVQDTNQFVGFEVSVKVKTRPATDQYSAQSEVKSWKAIEGRVSAAPAMRQQAAPAPAPAANRPPWAK